MCWPNGSPSWIARLADQVVIALQLVSVDDRIEQVSEKHGRWLVDSMFGGVWLGGRVHAWVNLVQRR